MRGSGLITHWHKQTAERLTPESWHAGVSGEHTTSHHLVQSYTSFTLILTLRNIRQKDMYIYISDAFDDGGLRSVKCRVISVRIVAVNADKKRHVPPQQQPQRLLLAPQHSRFAASHSTAMTLIMWLCKDTPSLMENTIMHHWYPVRPTISSRGSSAIIRSNRFTTQSVVHMCVMLTQQRFLPAVWANSTSHLRSSYRFVAIVTGSKRRWRWER